MLLRSLRHVTKILVCQIRSNHFGLSIYVYITVFLLENASGTEKGGGSGLLGGGIGVRIGGEHCRKGSLAFNPPRERELESGEGW